MITCSSTSPKPSAGRFQLSRNFAYFAQPVFVLVLLLLGSLLTSAQTFNNNLSFAGNNFVQAIGPNPNLPQGNSPRTIEAWINPRSSQNGTIFNYGTFLVNARYGLLFIAQRLYTSS